MCDVWGKGRVGGWGKGRGGNGVSGRDGKGCWIPGGLGWARRLMRKKQVERKQERQELKNQI